MPPGPGDTVDHYRLERLLGSGGMGDVFLARDVLLRRQVAVKFVSAGRADDPALEGRLLKEARAVAAIEHECICPVYDAGKDEAGRPYIVMAYVEGETLSAKLARGPIPVADAVTLCGEIAGALAAAHEKGIIHRDLKPGNILVTPFGKPKLLDFGIAQFLPSSQFIAADTDTTTGLTARHTFVGTPPYMAPEQVRSLSLDGRCDLFALGAVLYECLTGRRAFRGSGPVEIIGEVLHVDPRGPSTFGRGLTAAHDEVCRRLLAKNRDDRFPTASDAASEIRRLATLSTVAPTPEPPGPSLPWWRVRRAGWLAAVCALALLAATAGIARRLTTSLPAPPPDAQVWFQKGTDALREGAFHSAAKALEEGIRRFPDSPTAYARLAEARAELDDQSGTQQALVQLSQRFPNEAVLSEDDRLRVNAMRWLVQRDLEKAVLSYRQLAHRRPGDAGAWVDLGRAQEAAVQLADAKGSFTRALAVDPQLPAAYVHLGNVDAYEGRTAEALQAYAEAERLYQTASDMEGQTEVLIRRGLLFDTLGEYARARPPLERAVGTATAIQSPSHLVRAQLALSSVTASNGQFAEAERLATAATDAAIEGDLDVVAADGLVDLASTLQFSGRTTDAQTVLEKARRLADKRGAPRTAARVQAQLASLQQQRGEAAAALTTVLPAVDFFRAHRYLKLELAALSIAARAYSQNDELTKARDASAEGLKIAEASGNDSQIAEALVSLAGLAANVGSLPEALAYRERAEAIHRRQNDVAMLPYDLNNRAELLIQLGRIDEASAALDEVEAGVSRKDDAYVGRQPRATLLRALAMLISGKSVEAARIIGTMKMDPASSDPLYVLGTALLDYARARSNSKGTFRSRPASETVARSVRRERQYWLAATLRGRGDMKASLTAASEGLHMLGSVGNDELAWRLAAVGCIAARSAGESVQTSMCSRAAAALARLRSDWGDAAGSYERRPDLAELRTDARL